MKLFIRPLRVLFLTLLSYLLDVCVMRHLYIGSVTASACLAGIAIITVSYGKKAAKKRRLYNGRLECVFYIYD